jgi:hypothetical protein
MKIAIALRTCGKVFNYWTADNTRMVDVDKETLILTCLNSLLKSISECNHDVAFSIHDDSSSEELLTKMGELCSKHNVPGDLINSGKLGNFKTQYEWLKKQDCDYVYCIEDDYLHRPNAITDMIEFVISLNEFNSGEYAIFPFNCPHRYSHFQQLYPSYIIKGPKQYWRSCVHSTHSFFISKKAFKKYDDIMKFQAYNWGTNADWIEDSTINKIWRDQEVMMFTPLQSLAYHLADKSQEDPFDNWQQLWSDNLV